MILIILLKTNSYHPNNEWFLSSFWRLASRQKYMRLKRIMSAKNKICICKEFRREASDGLTRIEEIGTQWSEQKRGVGTYSRSPSSRWALQVIPEKVLDVQRKTHDVAMSAQDLLQSGHQRGPSHRRICMRRWCQTSVRITCNVIIHRATPMHLPAHVMTKRSHNSLPFYHGKDSAHMLQCMHVMMKTCQISLRFRHRQGTSRHQSCACKYSFVYVVVETEKNCSHVSACAQGGETCVENFGHHLKDRRLPTNESVSMWWETHQSRTNQSVSPIYESVSIWWETSSAISLLQSDYMPMHRHVWE